MIAKMNKAPEQYKTKELCQLLKLPRSSYYYQVKGKSLNDNTNAMIKFIKQTAIEVGYTYGKRRMRVSLNSRPLKTTPNKPKPPILPTIQINKTAFYPAPQKTLGILQKISPVFAKTKK